MNDPRNVENGNLLPVVEHFYSLQGEGYHTGKAAYFIRIGGCDVGCSWCDSRYSWNPDLHPLVTIEEIVDYVRQSKADSVVITGGEPLMWDMTPLTALLKNDGILTYLETSGAYTLTGHWDWICLSPKKNRLPEKGIYSLAGELKVIIETEKDFDWAEENMRLVSKECKLFLQPEWSKFDAIIERVVDFIKEKKVWSISLQSHKYMKIP
jgi:organic radical activating enzyme